MRRASLLLAPVALFALGGATGLVAQAAAPAPGPLIPETQFADTVVTLTAAGDPATAVSLRAPLSVGASGDTTSALWERGSDTYRRGPESVSTDFEFTVDRTGVDEVLEARPDGGALVRWTYGTIESTQNWSDPDFAQDPPDLSSLEGASVLVEFDPARQSRAVYQDAAAPLTQDQAGLMTGDRLSLTIPLPAEPVGVGGTWTWSYRAGVYGVLFDLPMTTTLTSVDGDRYTASTSFSIDLAVGPVQIRPDSGVAAVRAGMYSGTLVSDGSISNPLDYHEKWESTHRVAFDLTDGWTLESQGAITAEYWERSRGAAVTPTTVAGAPAPTAPAPTAPAPTAPAPTAPAPTAPAPTAPAPTAPAPTAPAPTAPAPTAPAPTGPPPTAAAAGTQLVDDTGAITVVVPSTWTQTLTSPYDTGQARLVASPDLATFSPEGKLPSQYTVPGVLMMVTNTFPDTLDPARFLPFLGCATKGEPTPYADGTFTGSLVMNEACGDTGSRVAVMVGNRNDGTSALTVIVVLTEPGDELLTSILRSIDGDPTT